MKKIIQVVGARPNFMKVAPIHRAILEIPDWDSCIVHTGQHRDVNMSDIFFKQLQLNEPRHFLGVKSGSHTQMTADIMLAFEGILDLEKPDLVIVVGDVTSTLACALTSVRCGIPVAHVEAGLRSWDRNMPEEINRILTDQLSDVLFTTEGSGAKNLLQENIPEHKIHFVGNCMIDSLIRILPFAQHQEHCSRWGLLRGSYALMTMHRPTNVDTEIGLRKIIQIVECILKEIPVVFPVHPRTRNRLMEFGLWTSLEQQKGLFLTEPLGYIEFISLLNDSRFILTDSGGIQEESTFLKIPCLTFRKTTERPVTVEVGSNRMISDLSMESVHRSVLGILTGQTLPSEIPELWDGHAGKRIVEVLLRGKM
ncbi:MAG: UDP-N-acetylglucosamine 2-epimerase (non-hydrolyzing) [Saprospiraceae bacterium]|nr:UDP-N-acetylglucosamine 2-epimerase (non-hydrolyzing) [Saprospiraceae bacterium]